MKASTEERIKHIFDWSTTIINFLNEKLDESLLTEQLLKAIDYEQNKKDAIEKNITPSMRLRGYQEAQNDLHSMAKHFLNPKQYEDLNKLLKEQYNVNINDISNEKKAKRILKRGAIKNDMEFRLLNEVVDELIQTDGAPTLIEQYNELLLNYEKSKMV